MSSMPTIKVKRAPLKLGQIRAINKFKEASMALRRSGVEVVAPYDDETGGECADRLRKGGDGVEVIENSLILWWPGPPVKHPLASRVRHVSETGGVKVSGWYFIDETDDYVGPYRNQPCAINACGRYARSLK